MHARHSAWLALFGAFVVASCSGTSTPVRLTAGDAATCLAGTETCPCYPNVTCNAGLTCFSNLCVNASSDAAGSEASAETGADSAALSAVESGAESGSASSSGGGASSSGGGSSSGAGSSSGTAPPGDSGAACSPLIDDMESGTNAIIGQCGRTGQWFTYNDGGGVQWPSAALADGGDNAFLPSLIPGGRGASMYAAHTFGSGFASYGGMGFTLGGPADSANPPYDAKSRGYTGFSFYAMLGTTQAGAQTFLEFHATDKFSEPSGGLCNASLTSGSLECFDNPKTRIALTPTWTLVTVPFGLLQRSGWGYGGSTPLDTTGIYSVGFEDNSSAGNTAPYAFDVWIDDVSFTM